MTSRTADSRARLSGDELASLVTHELRNPLNAMSGWLHLLSNPKVKPDTAERALAGLQRALEQQLAQVDTLGQVLRLSAGSGVPVREPIALGALLADCVAALRPAAEAVGREVALDLEPAAQPGASDRIAGDPAALRSALCALGAHALRHGVPGAALRIALHAGDPERVVRITLSIDEGDDGGLSIWQAFAGGGARLPLGLLHAMLAIGAHGAGLGPQGDGRVGDVLEIRFDAIDAAMPPHSFEDSRPGGVRP